MKEKGREMEVLEILDLGIWKEKNKSTSLRKLNPTFVMV